MTATGCRRSWFNVSMPELQRSVRQLAETVIEELIDRTRIDQFAVSH